MKIGMIFPGQGAQFLGMGKDLYDNERVVQELFEEASNCLNQNFVRLCFASSEKELKETINAQTSIFLLSASIYTLLSQKYGINPQLVAGHSSGEYAAIYAAGGLNFPDALYLLKKRSEFMDEATKNQKGGMSAVIGLEYKILSEICKKYNTIDNNEKVLEIVNYNAENQLVVSGTLQELDLLAQETKVLNGKVIPLNVEGAFHSRLMKSAEDLFDLYMVKVDFKDLNIDLVNNIEAKIIKTADEIRSSLVRQMSSPVLWWHSMQHFKDLDIILEVGPSSKLAKILQRAWPEKQVLSVTNLQDLEKVATLLGKNIEKKETEIFAEVQEESKVESINIESVNSENTESINTENQDLQVNNIDSQDPK